ncbi:MAG TPA: RsmD family RNA methyltransferase, partial [Gemmatimonadaceae bacterium]|nr:RsmD family RNA methyltransferase [Gemmatimonadaceae bacterium]
MRIVAGRWRGRTIKAPADDRVRPTADRVREAWMSIVQPVLPGAKVVDLFAGSGALGLEALSRGAEQCDFVEIGARSLAALRANIEKLGAGDAAHIVRGDALKFALRLEAGAYDV